MALELSSMTALRLVRRAVAAVAVVSGLAFAVSGPALATPRIDIVTEDYPPYEMAAEQDGLRGLIMRSPPKPSAAWAMKPTSCSCPGSGR
jgi:hypothetical protein